MELAARRSDTNLAQEIVRFDRLPVFPKSDELLGSPLMRCGSRMPPSMRELEFPANRLRTAGGVRQRPADFRQASLEFVPPPSPTIRCTAASPMLSAAISGLTPSDRPPAFSDPTLAVQAALTADCAEYADKGTG